MKSLKANDEDQSTGLSQNKNYQSPPSNFQTTPFEEDKDNMTLEKAYKITKQFIEFSIKKSLQVPNCHNQEEQKFQAVIGQRANHRLLPTAKPSLIPNLEILIRNYPPTTKIQVIHSLEDLEDFSGEKGSLIFLPNFVLQNLRSQMARLQQIFKAQEQLINQ